MSYKERLQKIDTALGVLISRANALRTNSYTVTISGGYFEEGKEAMVAYSLDNGNTWHEVTSTWHVINNVTQIMLKNLDRCAGFWDQYYTVDGDDDEYGWSFIDGVITKNFTIRGNTVFGMGFDY